MPASVTPPTLLEYVTDSELYGNGGLGVWGRRTWLTLSLFLSDSGSFAPLCDHSPTASVPRSFNLPSNVPLANFTSKASFDLSSKTELNFNFVALVGAFESASKRT